MAKKPQDAAGSDGAQAPITIKKYANRRLYNTETSSYVTLDNLAQMVKDGKEFTVYDAKTSEDITRSVLTSSSKRNPRGRTCCRSVSCVI